MGGRGPDLDIETTLYVAIWQTPAIFQGVFEVTEREGARSVHLLFRC